MLQKKLWNDVAHKQGHTHTKSKLGMRADERSMWDKAMTIIFFIFPSFHSSEGEQPCA